MTKPPGGQRKCGWCQAPFTPGRSIQKFCTPAHARAFSNKHQRKTAPKEPRICALEGCEIQFVPKRMSQRFCTTAHGTRAASLARSRGSPVDPDGVDDADLVALAEQRGYLIHRPQPPELITKTVDLDRVRGKRVRFAAVSCTHFGSKHQQLTALHEFVNYAKQQKVDYLVHAGDITDGPFGRHRNPHEVFLHEYDRVVEYTVDRLPKVGIPWLMISGNHDDWYTLDGGADIVGAIAKERDDITYLGRSLGYLRLPDGILIEAVHPSQGTAYAYSYRLQKHIESLAPAMKPHVVWMGNFHKFCSIYYRNVLGIQLPAFQSQTAWMAGKSLVSEVGGIILEVGARGKGLAPSAKFEVVYTYSPRDSDWP